MSSLHAFSGGLKLEVTTPSDLTIEIMPLPSTLEFVLQSRTGNALTVCIKQGDHVRTGQPLAIAEDETDAPILASACGTIASIDRTRLTLDTNRAQNQQYPVPEKDNADPAALTTRLYHCGVRGLGGAAFSGFAKIHAAADTPLDTLVINAAECEPLICCDQALVRESAPELAHAIVSLALLLKARRCLIGIESCNPVEYDLLHQALDALQPHNVSVQAIPTIYPSGSEKQLVKILTGITVASGKFPRDYGVLNFNLASALSAIAAWEYGQPQINRVVTVAGDALENVRNIRVPFGTRFTDLLQFVGIDGKHHKRVTLGGPMSGLTVTTDETVVSAASNCVLVNQPLDKPPDLPCIRCGECDKVCPAQLLPQQLHWFCNSDNLADAQAFHLGACIECGCCDYVCPSRIALTSQFRTAKQTVAEQQRNLALATLAQQRFDAREARLQRKTEERERRLQQRKAEVEKKASLSASAQTAPDQDAIAAALARARERKNKRKKSG